MAMMLRTMLRLLSWGLCLLAVPSAHGQRVISGNENKLDLASGEQVVLTPAEPDTLSILDFSEFPPTVEHVRDIANTVIGPPSNIAVTPDGSLALIANSLKRDPQDPDVLVPDNVIHVLDLTASPPKVVDQVTVGMQPSGMSFTPDGKLALVANRAGGTVSVLRIDGQKVEHLREIEVGEPEDQVSDVAISPDGHLALTSINAAGHLRALTIDGETVEATERKISTYGTPYRCAITPDGQLGLTAGSGLGGAPDEDALTIVDLTAEPIRTIDYVPIGSGPESFEISPDGRLVAVVLMNGSNLATDDPNRTEEGMLTLLARRGKTFEVVQHLPVGRIPEGVAFTADGEHLLVQCHPAREIWIFRVSGERIIDTSHRVEVPGMPSSLRAVNLP